jgi:hypothetical protein
MSGIIDKEIIFLIFNLKTNFHFRILYCDITGKLIETINNRQI